MVLINSHSVADTTNKAYSIIEYHLQVIKNYVEGKDPDPSLKRSGSIWFFEKLTGIDSDAPGGWNGKVFATVNDYNRWYKWYLINKENIYWDEAKKTVVFHIEVSPPN